MDSRIIQQFTLATRGLPQQQRSQLARDAIIRVLAGQVSPYGNEGRPDNELARLYAQFSGGMPGPGGRENSPEDFINQFADGSPEPGGHGGFAGGGFSGEAGLMPTGSGAEQGFANFSPSGGGATFPGGLGRAYPAQAMGSSYLAGYAEPNSGGAPAAQPPAAGGEMAAKEGGQAKGKKAEENRARDSRCDFNSSLCSRIVRAAQGAVTKMRARAADVTASKNNPKARVLTEIDTYFGKGARDHLQEIADRINLMANRLENAKYEDGSDTLGRNPRGRVELFGVRTSSTRIVRVNVREFQRNRKGIRDTNDWRQVPRYLFHEAAHLSGLRGHQTIGGSVVYGSSMVRRLAREKGYAATSRNASNFACFIDRGLDC